VFVLTTTNILTVFDVEGESEKVFERDQGVTQGLGNKIELGMW
jgi:hypothetical protein